MSLPIDRIEGEKHCDQRFSSSTTHSVWHILGAQEMLHFNLTTIFPCRVTSLVRCPTTNLNIRLLSVEQANMMDC